MKTTHIILSIFASVALLASCSEKLLDIPQQGVQSEANSYITDEDCEAATAAVYAAWRHAWSGTGSSSASGTTYCNLFWFKTLLSDEAHSASHSGQQELGDYTYTNAAPWIGAIYEFLYKTIYLANIVLDKFQPESETKIKCIAEAKFFRALCYYELITLWGRVPLVDHVMTAENNYQIAPSEIDALWAFVLKDLDEAIAEDAPEPILGSKKNMDDKETGTRITLEAAYAVRGKVHLTMKNYKAARDDFGKVITSGKYDLITNIEDLYHTEANGCKEYIFENVRHWDTNNLYVNGADAAQDGWYGLEDNWLFAYGMEAADDAPYKFVTMMGWGAVNPTKKVYDAFIAEEGATSPRRLASVVGISDLPALKVTIKTLQWTGNEGYFRFKWLMRADDEWDAAWTGRLNNTPCMRYADVLLMMAEACIRDGVSGDEYINKVRTRAGLGTLTGATMADVKKERLLELCFEATRLQDLKRWDECGEGDLMANLGDKGKKIPKLIGNADGSTLVEWVDNPDPSAGWNESKRYLPYPLVEIQTNKLITQ